MNKGEKSEKSIKLGLIILELMFYFIHFQLILVEYVDVYSQRLNLFDDIFESVDVLFDLVELSLI